jgi:hypothetical protein
MPVEGSKIKVGDLAIAGYMNDSIGVPAAIATPIAGQNRS